jgi:hypothetical protein
MEASKNFITMILLEHGRNAGDTPTPQENRKQLQTVEEGSPKSQDVAARR